MEKRVLTSEAYAKAMKVRRKHLGLTQADLADVTGVSLATINQVELGRRNPDLTTLEKISAGLSTSVEELLLQGRHLVLSEDSNIRQSLGREIGRLRDVRGLSRNALALRSNTSSGYISELERGLCSPTVDKLLAISSALNVPAWKVLKNCHEAEE